jgi:histidinol-phosphatase
VLIRADGAARGNPGPAAAGAVIIDADRADASDAAAPPVAVVARPLGIQTNNFAEYTAVVLALGLARRLGAEEVELVLDSKLVVEQLHGRWKVRHPALAGLHADAQRLLADFRRWSARHEPRASNHAADALANLALDDPAAAAEAEHAYALDAPPAPSPPQTASGTRQPDRDPASLLEFAHRLVDETDAILQRHFSAEIEATEKADRTLVTAADTEVEEFLRSRLRDAFPGHGVLGEEHGYDAGDGDSRWIIDPIDATANFARGVPVFATLLALERDGRLQCGVVSAPALGQRWSAASGRGATTRIRGRERPISVSGRRRLDEAQLLFGTLRRLETSGRLDRWRSAIGASWRDRGFGDFWGHVLVAQGSAEAMLDEEVEAWDLAAPAIVLLEAGGRMTDLQGRPSWSGPTALSSNGLLHKELLAIMAAPAP